MTSPGTALTTGRHAQPAAAAPRGPWAGALAGSVLGPRGFSKMSHLWLPCALMLAGAPGAARDIGLAGVLLLAAAVLCKVQFSILVNDLSDREDDRAAGKVRWIASLPGGVGAAVVAAVLAAGFAAVSLGGGPRAIAAYVATVLLALAYSLRPLRCKERGLAGPAVYALSAAVVYVVLPWAWLGARPAAAAVALVAVLSDKWVQLHFHQVLDHDADRRRGTSTYAVRVGADRARSTLGRAAAAAVVALGAAVVFAASAAGTSAGRLAALLALTAAALAASGVYAARSRLAAQERTSALVRELPWPYLGLAYLCFHALPPLLFALAAGEDRALWALALLSGLSLAAVSWQTLAYRHA